jgi:hypothetical protein
LNILVCDVIFREKEEEVEVGKVFIVVRIEGINHGRESNIIHILQHIKALDISIYLVELAILNHKVSKVRV